MEKNFAAVITGGAQGIGRIVADFLEEAGWMVAIWDNDAEAIEEEQGRWKNKNNRTGIICDVTCVKSVQNAIAETISALGRIDLLVNNAAIQVTKPIHQLEVPEFRRVIDVNLTGAFICVKYCEPELRRNKGSVINICSTRAIQSEPHTEAYSASKGGICSMTHAMAISLGPDIRVNSISPGWIDVSAVRKSTDVKQEFLTGADHLQHPAGRVGDPADIARMVYFLADPGNDFITAQNFIVDGGMTRKMIYV
jgi:NAD(P)-dependent dehydrogenase (short-subunit alcohol dehydrogenase family)